MLKQVVPQRPRRAGDRVILERPAWRLLALAGALVAALVAGGLAGAGATQAAMVATPVLDGGPTQAARPAALPLAMVTPLSGGMTRPLEPVADEDGAMTVSQEEVVSTGSQLVLHVGHVDLLAPQLVDGELVMTVKDDSRLHDPGIVFRDPSDVTLTVPERARVEVPEGLDFLGDAGDQVWVLPQTQDPDLLWPGWSNEHESLFGELDDPITFRLISVSGPGRFVMYQTVGFGDFRIIASTVDGLPASWAEPVGAHVHASWAFGAPGTYTFRFEASGTLSDGTDVTTGPADYTFVVEGDLDDPDDEDDDNGDEDEEDNGEDDDGEENGGDDETADEDGDDTNDEGTGGQGGGDAGRTDSLADTSAVNVGSLSAGAVSALLFGVALIGQPRRRGTAPRRRTRQ